MTTPTENPFEPAPEFGPVPTPDSEFSEPAKETKKEKKSPFSNLGNNDRRVRGAPRKLTDEDREKLLAMYASIGMLANMKRPETGAAILQNAERCVDADFKLAEKNNSVRRAILAMMETSAWTEVFMAHLPIIISIVPNGAWNRIISFMPNMETPQPEQGDEPISGFWAGVASANGDRP